MTERVVDLLEMVDVAQNERQSALVTRSPVDLAREVLAGETAAGRSGQIIRRREFAVLLPRKAQHGLEFGDAPRQHGCAPPARSRSPPFLFVV
jgi:hypothetical protein